MMMDNWTWMSSYGFGHWLFFAVMVAQWWQAGDPFAFQKTSALWGRHTTLPISPLVDRLQEILVLRNFNAVTFTDFACVVIVLWLAAYSTSERVHRVLSADLFLPEKKKVRVPHRKATDILRTPKLKCPIRWGIFFMQILKRIFETQCEIEGEQHDKPEHIE